MRVASLVLNGYIDKDWLGKTLLGKTDIYCADGAFNTLSELNIKVEKVLGDMDSIDKTLKDVPMEVLEDQDMTDFEKSIIYLNDKYDSLGIYGASGGDVDHLLDSLSVAKKYRKKIDLLFHEPTQYYFFMKNPTSLKGVKDKTVSIMPFPKLKSVCSQGLQYPLDKLDMELGNKTSARNFAIQDKVTIEYAEGCGIVVVEK